MRSRLSTGILNRLILLIFMYLFLVFCFAFLSTNFYVTYKNYQLMDVIYEAEDVHEIISAANKAGYVVTVSNDIPHISNEDEVLTVIDGYAVINNNDHIELVGPQVIQFNINPYIVNDFSKLLLAFIAFTAIVFLIIVLLIYFYMQKRVIVPASEIVNLISNKNSDYKFNYDDEFLIIKTELEIKNKRIQSELELKNEILKAITHELKTPLAKISTIMYLHKNQVDGYEVLEDVEEMINEIITINEELINKTLSHFNDNIADGVVTVQEEIDSLVSQYMESGLIINKLYVKDYEIKSNFLVAKFVIANVISNAFKYADKYIDIRIDGNQLIVSNDYTKNISKKGNGLKIVNKLIENKNIDVNYFYSQDVYEVVITFN